METTVYVGNLNQSTREQDLRSLFAEAGGVMIAQVIASTDADPLCCSGIITMATEEGAKKAVVSLNGRMVDGHILSVTEVQPRDGDGGGSRKGGGSYSRVRSGVYAVSKGSSKY